MKGLARCQEWSKLIKLWLPIRQKICLRVFFWTFQFLEKAKVFQENIHFSHILSRLSVELPRGNILMQIYENAEEPKERGNDFFFLNRKSQNVSLPYRKKTCMVWPQKFICSQLEISLFMSDTCLEDSVALYVAILEKSNKSPEL